MTHIRIFAVQDGESYDTRDTYEVSNFGTIPIAGDIIVSPWADQKAERQDPTQRTFYEVVRRYFSPASRDDVWVVLVVKERPGTWAEADIFNN